MWTAIIQGRVGIALNAVRAKMWRDGGASIVLTGGSESRQNTVLGVSIVRPGWRQGFCLVAAYAPVSDPKADGERATLIVKSNEIVKWIKLDDHFAQMTRFWS